MKAKCKQCKTLGGFYELYSAMVRKYGGLCHTKKKHGSGIWSTYGVRMLSSFGPSFRRTSLNPNHPLKTFLHTLKIFSVLMPLKTYHLPFCIPSTMHHICHLIWTKLYMPRTKLEVRKLYCSLHSLLNTYKTTNLMLFSSVWLFYLTHVLRRSIPTG